MIENSRIYYNDRCVYFTEYPAALMQYDDIDNVIIVRNHNDLNDYDEIFEQFLITEVNNIIFQFDPEKGIEFMKKKYTHIYAGGGIVENDRGEILLIYRTGHWDLPKGKLDKGETIKECAIREVMEETGILNLDINILKEKTFHMYLMRDEMILKETYWYEMYSNDTNLRSQKKEGIQKTVWVHRNNLKQHVKKSYRSIQFIMRDYI